MEDEKWKSFINENRGEFDSETPGDQVWNGIQSGIRTATPRMVKLSSVLRIAAAVIVLFSAGLVWIMNGDKNENSLAVQNNSPAETEYVLASFSPEYAEMETYYVRKIKSTQSELETMNPDAEMMLAVKDLDVEFNRLKAEMKEQVNQDAIVEAMIENYRLKLDLLERMLESLKEQKNENENEELQTI